MIIFHEFKKTSNKNLIFYFSTNYQGLNITTAGTYYVALALKVNSLYEQGCIKPINITLSYDAGPSNNCSYQLQFHSTYGSIGSTTGTLTYGTLSYSIGQSLVGDGTQTLTSDGYVLSSGSLNSQNSINLSSNDFELLLPRAICTRYNSTLFDTLFLFATSSTNNAQVFASIDFIELI